MNFASLSVLTFTLILSAFACTQTAAPQEVDFFERGVLRMKQEDLDGAIAEFDKAVAERPDHADAIFERGIARCMKIEVEAALADFEKAISLAPQRADF